MARPVRTYRTPSSGSAQMKVTPSDRDSLQRKKGNHKAHKHCTKNTKACAKRKIYFVALVFSLCPSCHPFFYGIARTTPPSTLNAAPLVALAAGLHT
jgi:hypothetical protein